MLCPYKVRKYPFNEKPCYYMLLLWVVNMHLRLVTKKLQMLVVTRYLYHKWYTKKRKAQIDGWFLNLMHILGQEKILFMVNKVITGYWRGYHLFLLKVVCQKRKPQIDGPFINVLHLFGQEKSMHHVFLPQVVCQKRKPQIDGLYLNVLNWYCICHNWILHLLLLYVVFVFTG